MITQNSSKLEKLIEFAEKGGIGTCVANQDIIAKSEADLMFYTGEVITVLKHIKDDIYLGYCEGVIGTFKGKTVDFNGSLKNLKSMKSEKRSQSSPVDSPADSYDQHSPKQSPRQSPRQSPKQTSFLHPSDSAKSSPSSLSNDTNLRSLDTENKSQPSLPSPTINIIPATSDNTYNNNNSSPILLNQNNVPIIIPTQRKSSMSTERSIPRSPRKYGTMPQQSSPEPILSQRRNNTVPIIAIQPVNSEPNNINSPLSLPSSPQSHIMVSNDKINSNAFSQNQFKQPLPNINDQVITRKRQNSIPAVLNYRQDNMQNVSIERPSGFKPQIPGMQNNSVPPRIEISKLQQNEHRRSKSIPNISPFSSSQSSSSISSSSPPYSPSTLSNSIQYKSYSQEFNTMSGTIMVNGRNSPSESISSPPHSPDLYQGFPDRVSGQNSPLPNLQMQDLSQKYPTGISDDVSQSVIGHYSPSTSPLPSPKMSQLKVFQEEGDDHYSPSTTPLSSPNSASKNIPNATNTPAPTPMIPIIVTPRITLEDSDLDDSDYDQEEEVLISYASSSNNDLMKSSPSFNPLKPTEVSTLKVEQISYFRSDTPSEQLSTNESEDISSDDEDENKVEVKNESESEEIQSSKPAKKKKDQILAIDEYGFVYDVAEEDIPPGADRIQRIIQAPGTEEKTTRTIRLYREREAKWVALLGSTTRDSKKIKKLVRQGIPESVRGKAWQFMACADKYRKPGVFDDLRNKPRLPIYDEIERDIHRCYPDHIQFREESGFGQDDLHDILKAFAHYNQAIGYCQGMGRLVGMMLMQMPAEDTFWLLVATIEEYMVGYFTPTLSQVRIDSMVFGQLLDEYYPKLAQHLADNGVVPLMYMTQWFMTIFTMALPWASVLRVWDIFYFEGVKLFFRIGLAIMDCTKEHILKKCPSNSEILGFLLHLPPDLLTPDLLLEAAYKIRLKRSAIRRMTKRAITMEKNNEVGSDVPSFISAGSSKETRRGLMKKSKSADKLRIDGVEFKLVGE